MFQNSINGNAFGTSSLAGAKFVRVFGSNLALGDTDLYTVPAGKKAYMSLSRQYNGTGGSVTWFGQIKVSGTYYRTSANTTITTGSPGTTLLTTIPTVLIAGDTLSINTATTAGLNVWIPIIEFNATETKLATSRILGLANGQNTLYTVPAGKTASGISTFSSIVLAWGNSSGGTLNYTTYNVTSGGTPGTTNQFQGPVSTATNTIGSMNVQSALGAGDFISINTTAGTATQIAWITYYEI